MFWQKFSNIFWIKFLASGGDPVHKMSKCIPWDLGLAGIEMLNIICDRAETAPKIFGLFLHAKGCLNVYGRVADDMSFM